MDFQTLETLRTTHPAWRLLRAEHGPLIASFLHRVFVKPNVRQMPEADLARHLDDDFFKLRRELGEEKFPREAKAYLDDWASDKNGWLRKRYVAGSDEAHFDITPATEAALTWLSGLGRRPFISTESRLRTVFDLLRDLINDTEPDMAARTAELMRRRAEIDDEIARLAAGDIPVLDDAVIRDRFHLIVETAQSLLSDFRAVEQNFRLLDRDARIKISAWEGSKGELLDRILGDRDAIAESDQGRSFRAFYDLLMSADRQDELTHLLERMLELDPVKRLKPDRRIRRVHFDWLTAAEATQRTVAKLSSELRRYLDDKAWLENRRIMRLLRDIEANAVEISDRPPTADFMELDDMALDIRLPMDRPLFSPPHRPELDDAVPGTGDEDVSADALFDLVHVDKRRLRAHIWRALQRQDQIALKDIIAEHPLELGLAELVAYLSIASEEADSVVDDSAKTTIHWIDAVGASRRATMPRVVFVRQAAAPADFNREQEAAP
jgi:flagellar motility protein MotE (MotC chaperone)